MLGLVRDLREEGLVVDLEMKGRAIGKAFGWADGIGASHVLVVGPRDFESGQANLKRLSDGEQMPVALNREAVLAALTS